MWKTAVDEQPKGHQSVRVRYVNENGDVLSTGSGAYIDNGPKVSGSWVIRHDDPRLVQMNEKALNDATLQWEVPEEQEDPTAMPANIMQLMFGMLDTIHCIVVDKNIGQQQPTFSCGIKMWVDLCDEYGRCSSIDHVCPLYGMCKGAPVVNPMQLTNIAHILRTIYEQGGGENGTL